MKALYLSKKGGPEALEYGELPDPVIEDPMDVIVRVRAAGMNRLDVMQRDGSHGATPPEYPFITGREFSGDVVEVGKMAGNLQVGTRVVVDPLITCGSCRYCLVGDDGNCPNGRMLGVSVDGTELHDKARSVGEQPLEFFVADNRRLGDLTTGQILAVFDVGNLTMIGRDAAEELRRHDEREDEEDPEGARASRPVPWRSLTFAPALGTLCRVGARRGIAFVHYLSPSPESIGPESIGPESIGPETIGCSVNFRCISFSLPTSTR